MDSSHMDHYSDEDVEIFDYAYRCYPVSSVHKSSLKNGNRIIMPPSALNRLVSLRIEYPMLFEVRNPFVGRVSHCGVLEFIADERKVYMPNWMMENLRVKEGDIVTLRSTSLAKGTFVKLQPHTKDFLDISNSKAVLETSLRHYSCLTTGDTIMIAYNNKNYFIDVVETKPFHAVSIIDTDCEVDFAQPLDYKEPERNMEHPEVDDDLATKIAGTISPFTGSGRRLDGKPSTQENESKSCNSTPSNSASSCRTSGKLVVGSDANASNIQKTPPKVEEPKFQAFTGKSYSLRN
ncbi:hypothetical protein RJT34_30053 [Clitoria ternatea]|uniref:Ubiquitin fusion degradaton protein n=1 Tax=Clitoria ternatea TaxID=43366 RepID=A0AAN9I2A4_CLITE